MVGRGGLEPPTSRLSGVRSNQAELPALIHNSNQSNIGGAGRNRTDDLLLAKQALYQLSYSPVSAYSRVFSLILYGRDMQTAVYTSFVRALNI